MSLTIEQAVGQKLMLSFTGTEPSAEILELLSRQHVGGLTLYRALNMESPAQVRRLTAALQQAAAASDQPPLLIAADHEGGTLLAVGGTTPFPGNLALGAAGSPDLARRTGRALGLELAAMGINVDYAPVCDLLFNPVNPVVGPRSFGEDPARAAELSAAMVQGLQAGGVAATPKHFPGHGDTPVDSHFGTPVSLNDEQRLRDVELLPFRAGIAAGARLVMTAHVALPALNGGIELPTTLSSALVGGLLRRDLGFAGVIITDALDMQAIRQGPGLVIDTIAALAAGVDLLLLNAAGTEQPEVYAGLVQATRRMLLSAEENLASAQRILDLKQWVSAQAQPGMDVVACAEHRALADEVAARALTLVRDEARRLPLRLSPAARVAVIVPRPADLTPADTSSYIEPALAQAMRQYHPMVEEFVIALDPTASEVEAVCQQVSGCEVIIAATINATQYPGQAMLVKRLLERGLPVIAVALRMPYDLLTYSTAPTYLCAYSILDPALRALAAALWGNATYPGRLPVSIPGMYPIGHGVDSTG